MEIPKQISTEEQIFQYELMLDRVGKLLDEIDWSAPSDGGGFVVSAEDYKRIKLALDIICCVVEVD